MLHEVLRTITEDAPPTTDSAHEILTALIASAAPLLGVLVALFTTLRGRGRRASAGDDAGKVARYERFLLRHDMDPDRVITGNEEMTDVRLL